jgi:hypothetical protein
MEALGGMVEEAYILSMPFNGEAVDCRGWGSL